MCVFVCERVSVKGFSATFWDPFIGGRENWTVTQRAPGRIKFPFIIRTTGARRSCDAQKDCRRPRARACRSRARVRQQRVRQGARAAVAAVLQVQGRGLLLQGVPGWRPSRARRTSRAAPARARLLTNPRPLPSPTPTPDSRVEGRACSYHVPRVWRHDTVDGIYGATCAVPATEKSAPHSHITIFSRCVVRVLFSFDQRASQIN